MPHVRRGAYSRTDQRADRTSDYRSDGGRLEIISCLGSCLRAAFTHAIESNRNGPYNRSDDAHGNRSHLRSVAGCSTTYPQPLH